VTKNIQSHLPSINRSIDRHPERKREYENVLHLDRVSISAAAAAAAARVRFRDHKELQPEAKEDGTVTRIWSRL
jgi:hypothetical protein